MTQLLIRLFVKDKDNIHNPAVRQRYGKLGGFVGIICNIILFALKLIAGLITSSISITADAFNNLSDAGSSVITLVGFKIAGKPADREHPFGHGRVEYVSGLIISLIIMLMGFELLKNSFDKILHPEDISFRWVSFGILIFSILLKLWMSFFNRKLGTIIQSAAMKATATDSLSDVIATSAVVVGVLVFYFFKINIDGWIGLVVAIFILFAGFSTARDTMDDLLGQAPDTGFVDSIKKQVMSYPDIIGIHDLIVHNYGPGRCLISLHAEVPCNVNMMEIHDIIDNIERDLNKTFQCEAVIHMDPIEMDDNVANELCKKVKEIVVSIDPGLTIHDFRMVAGPTHTNLIFDVVVPYRFELSDNEVTEKINEQIKLIDQKYETIISVDKSYTA